MLRKQIEEAIGTEAAVATGKSPGDQELPMPRGDMDIPGFRQFLSGQARTKLSSLSTHDIDRLRELMSRLARRMDFEIEWPAHTEEALLRHPTLQPWENPEIPAGYTYLLQLVAHDIVATSAPISIVENTSTGARNTRTPVLRLEAIYGAGPATCPAAYAPDDRNDTTRCKLRLGQMKSNPGDPDMGSRFRDIARTSAPDVTNMQRSGLTEPLVADPRNDDHWILSQLTTLFHHLHNGILDLLPATEKQVNSSSVWEAAHERFFCARGAVTLIYRNIIRKDLLRRVLHPDVYKAYCVDAPKFIDVEAIQGSGGGVERPAAGRAGVRGEAPAPPAGMSAGDPRIPLEFSYAAFRFGHAMVRGDYQLNERHPIRFPLENMLRRTSAKGPNILPLDHLWIVRWSHFFEINKSKPNLSRRIGPYFSPDLLTKEFFGKIDGTGKAGLAYRDLLGSGLVNLWSVQGLIERIGAVRSELIAGSPLLSHPAKRREQLLKWLSQYRKTSKFTDEDIETLADDPPLAFFVLFEAAADPTAPGLRLGVLGSIIVAEVIFAALIRESLHNEKPTGKLTDALAALATGVYGRNYLCAIPEIDSMDALIEFTAELSGLRHPRHGFL